MFLVESARQQDHQADLNFNRVFCVFVVFRWFLQRRRNDDRIRPVVFLFLYHFLSIHSKKCHSFNITIVFHIDCIQSMQCNYHRPVSTLRSNCFVDRENFHFHFVFDFIDFNGDSRLAKMLKSSNSARGLEPIVRGRIIDWRLALQ